jgi:undecaprenyl-diphosphatase
LPLVQIIVLAITQGITEFLPISSSAHLILMSRWMGWTDQGLGFDMAVHVGTLVAIVAYLRTDLAGMVRAFSSGAGDGKAGGGEAERRLGFQLLVATVPVAACGWFFQDWIGTWGRDVTVIAACSILFGAALWVADRFAGRSGDTAMLSWGAVLLLGGAQALALIPGTSRSGVVMTAALLLGLARTDAARVSFLMAVPVMLLVGAKNVFDLVGGEAAETEWGAIVLGFAISAVAAYLAVGWLMRWLSRQGMAVFAIYRIVLGLALLAGWLS